jgi:hypothetical protein
MAQCQKEVEGEGSGLETMVKRSEWASFSLPRAQRSPTWPEVFI